MNQSSRRARSLRKRMTDTERFVWGKLRDRRFATFKFRRQVPLGRYVVDFACFQCKFILELDGGGHQLQREYDAQRTEWLESQGFHVMRVWDHEALLDWDTVAEVIVRKLLDLSKSK